MQMKPKYTYLYLQETLIFHLMINYKLRLNTNETYFIIISTSRQRGKLIHFKLCTIAYQTLFSGEPSYLFSMLSLAPKPRELHSSGFHLLSISRVKTHTGTHDFSVVVPTLRNSLPEHVKSSNSTVSFRHHLKTHLFRLAYPS